MVSSMYPSHTHLGPFQVLAPVHSSASLAKPVQPIHQTDSRNLTLTLEPPSNPETLNSMLNKLSLEHKI